MAETHDFCKVQKTDMPTLTLHLLDGTKYTGISFGAPVETTGEVVFATGMVGYPESLTDPSYEGQILVLTYPLIGNYGVPKKDRDADGILKHFESDRIHVRGLVVSEYSENYNHWEAEKSLGDWLKEEGIPAITGIDTRTLTAKLRKHGVMLGRISADEKKPMETEFHDPNKENLVAQVSVAKPITYERGKKRIALFDCGAKNNIIRSLLEKNLTVVRVPWNYNIFTNNEKFDGIFISNGPGDPAILTEMHHIVKEALNRNMPVFGICLGAQILAHAAGGKTYKLKFGHRSQNQPCTEHKKGRCYITTQNHGYAIDTKSLSKDWDIWFTNANDNTAEGIRHKTLPFRAVQFHPEATPGPVESGYLFDEFLDMLS